MRLLQLVYVLGIIASGTLTSGQQYTAYQESFLLGLCGDNSHSIVVVSGDGSNGGFTEQKPGTGRGLIQSLHIDNLIQYRFAHTVISSTVSNPSSSSQEIFFPVVIPDTAMVSSFLLEVAGKVYKAYPRKRPDADAVYRDAVSSGHTAARINVRNAIGFNISVNVEPQRSVTLNVTYQQLLKRKLGVYTNVVHLNPGQIVRDLRVVTNIKESSEITKLRVPAFSVSGSTTNDGAEDSVAQISRISSTEAQIVFQPSEATQVAMTEQLGYVKETGLLGQHEVQYDVKRYPNGGELLAHDGYFVHFFAPTQLPPINKHAIFVLDVSGSMSGRKIAQLKDAMLAILSDLNTGDSFTIIEFESDPRVWDIDTGVAGSQCRAYIASGENVAKARTKVSSMNANGGTDIVAAVRKALECAKFGASTIPGQPEPIIMFLTDGQDGAVTGHLTEIAASNTNPRAPLYTLAFGSDADYEVLRKLALTNGGTATVIYEAADASAQLQNFYKSIASPLLTDVTVSFNYGQGVDADAVTQLKFKTYFSGAELVVAGRHPAPETVQGSIIAVGAGGRRVSYTVQVMASDPSAPLFGCEHPALERLWAFLKLSQLLDAQDAQTGASTFALAKASPRMKAKDLALKYSFVSPSTCLVLDWRRAEPPTTAAPPTTTTTTTTTATEAPDAAPAQEILYINNLNINSGNVVVNGVFNH